MSNDKFDVETQKEIGRAEALEAMFKSSGWKYAEDDLRLMISELKDIMSINIDDADVKQQIRDRINLAASLEHWIDELKGSVDNVKYLTETKKEERLITRR